MTNKLWWWEKTVEYSFVRKILADNAVACPLAGQSEKWTGDLIEQINDRFRLIEFKRNVNSIKDEDKKYGDGQTDYLTICKDISDCKNAAHWLVFGETIGEGKCATMKLKYRQYHSSPILQAQYNDLNQSSQLGDMVFSNFLKYIDELMKLRGNTEGGAGGLVMAWVGNDQTTVMDLTEFIQLIPSLNNKFGPAEEPHSKPSAPKL